MASREDSDYCMETFITKRGFMEVAQSRVEGRTIHVIYFLCRKGRIEDPHLIRVHHLSRNGIFLRDVKRWLAELRGKDMPESFSWSYKWKYMKGYVWQDLKDDDLITPHFNNEYVLKGSEISPSITSSQDTKQNQSNASMQKEPLVLEEAKEKSSSEIEEELPESTLPNDLMKVEEHKKKITMENAKPSSTTSDNSSSTKSKSYGSVKIFRNFITCRTAETDDSVLIPAVDRPGKLSLRNCSDDEAKHECREVFKVYPMNQPRNGASRAGTRESNSFCSPRKASPVHHMPEIRPTCSQCEKKFKPGELLRHMQYCKGMKANAKGSYPANATENRPRNSSESNHKKPLSACFGNH